VDWQEILLLARLARQAYRPEHHVGLPDGWTHVRTFKSKETSARGFIAVRQDAIVVSAEGTADVYDVIQDIKVNRVEALFGSRRVKVAMGFHENYVSLKEHVYSALALLIKERPGSKVYVTGHSLGGAMATLLGMDIVSRGVKAKVVTFGSPRVGNSSLKRLFNRNLPGSLRVVHDKDCIPWMPWWGFRHVGKKLHLDGNGRRIGVARSMIGSLREILNLVRSHFDGEVLKDHAMDSYIRALEQAAGRQG
jgi:triacylglycerol lipase